VFSFGTSIGELIDSSLEQEKNIKSEKKVNRFISMLCKTNLKKPGGCIRIQKLENFSCKSCNHIFEMNNPFFENVKYNFTIEIK
jgi:hypothetical protein